MSVAKAEVLITKLEAARRQLDAAIRMFFSNEDELAIHTVVSASYRILRDLKEKRGRTDLYDGLMPIVFGWAQNIVDGNVDAVPEWAKASELLEGLVQNAVVALRDGTIKTYDDFCEVFEVKYADEKQYWKSFNKSANFLKHADSDANGALSIDTINNVGLLLQACNSYGDIISPLTPEMTVFAIYYLESSEDSNVPGWSLAKKKSFLGKSQLKQKKICLSKIKQTKKSKTKVINASTSKF